MSNKSYRVTVKVRNANLLRAIEKSGNTCGLKFCEIAGINYHKLLSLVSMKSRPVDDDGNISPTVEKLCVFLNKMPNELFDREQMQSVIGSNIAEFDVDAEAMMQLTNRTSSDRIKCAIDNALESLNERNAKILRLSFGIDGDEKSCEEIAALYDVSSGRVRELKKRGLIQLNQGERNKILVSAISDEEVALW